MIQRHLAIDYFSIRCQKWRGNILCDWTTETFWQMFAWQSLQEKQRCSDLVRAHARVRAPGSGGGVHSCLLCRFLGPLLISVGFMTCTAQCLCMHLARTQSFVLAKPCLVPIPTAFSLLLSSFSREFLFLSIFAFGFLARGSVSCLYFRKLLLVSVKAFNVDVAKIKSQQSYSFWPHGPGWMSFHLNSQPDVLCFKGSLCWGFDNFWELK